MIAYEDPEESDECETDTKESDGHDPLPVPAGGRDYCAVCKLEEPWRKKQIGTQARSALPTTKKIAGPTKLGKS